jgi:hypothetical protein
MIKFIENFTLLLNFEVINVISGIGKLSENFSSSVIFRSTEREDSLADNLELNEHSQKIFLAATMRRKRMELRFFSGQNQSLFAGHVLSFAVKRNGVTVSLKLRNAS